MSDETILQDPAVEAPVSDPLLRVADANRRAQALMFGAQLIFLEETVFVADELLERARTETHLFAEFVSKLAGSHSVKDWGAACSECAQHQLDFIRRDCDRLFKHGERVIRMTLSLTDEPRHGG